MMSIIQSGDSMKQSFWNGKRAPGVSDELDWSTYQSVVDVLNETVVKFAKKPAFTSMNYSLSFEEIDQLSSAFAGFLRQECQLNKGDRVAVQLPNVLQSPVVIYGILKADLILVNTNPLYTAREMKEQFIDSGANALIFMDMFGDRVESIVGEVPIEHFIVTSFADLFPLPKRLLINSVLKYVKKSIPSFSLPQAISLRQALNRGKTCSVQASEAHLDDIAVLQYTGGTTGKPKGAMLTHKNLIANMLQAKAVFKEEDDNGQVILQEGHEAIVAPLPLYHIYAFTAHLMALFCMGTNNILIANPRDIPGFVKLLNKTHFTGFIGLNTLFTALLNHPNFSHCNFTPLKITLSGGTALSKVIADEWKEMTGVQISEGYGLTECSPIVCINPIGNLSQTGMIGTPVPETDLRVIDKNFGVPLEIGHVGELCVRGPQVMAGYWQKPEATAEVLSNDGWIKTGDVAEIKEDGFVRIVDRIKDVVLVSGFNVYPNEIEGIVAHHPDVLTCAVTGIPDQTTGEAVKLFVIPKNDQLTKKDIKNYCKQYLTGYKVPHHIEFREQLPMSPVGKVLRRELRKECEPVA